MTKQENLQLVHRELEQLSSFLENLLPFANAHNCDFITNNLWDLLPSQMSEELLCLSTEQLKLLPLGHTNFVSNKSDESKETVDLSDNCCRNFSVGCQCKYNLSKDLTSSANQMSKGEHHNEPVNHSNIKEKWNKSLRPSWTYVRLNQFVKEISKFKLQNSQVLSTKDSICKTLDLNNTMELHISHGMTAKKSHEIEVMTELCFNITEKFHLNKVIDIGSGKGYLGCQLAMTYNVQVLGIDSSKTNTSGATVRTQRVGKYWNGLVRNATKQRDDCGTDQNCQKVKLKCEKSPQTARENTKHNEERSVSNFDKSPQNDILGICKKTESLFADTEERSAAIPASVAKKHCFIPVTEYVTSETDLQQLLRLHFSESSPTSASDTERMAEKCNSILLTGLHTCGDLASSLLRLFIANTGIQVVCNVGCCYHLLEEEYVLSPYASNDDLSDSEPGFPLSQLLRSKQYKLGRNARMLACQAPDRLADPAKLPCKSLYWRALLQVILRDVTGTVCDNWHVGRIAAKCSNFKEYVKKAFSKLNIGKTMADEEIEKYEEEYRDFEAKLNAFFHLKALLAPCIEALIMLDRLCFLLQQTCVENAYLIQLFDIVKSPRCYAIVATKPARQDSTEEL